MLFVLPRRFPHKEYEKVGFDERVRLIEKIVENEPRFSVGVSEGGLFIEIAGEARALYGPETQLVFICGRDAAQRIVSWDYGEPDAFEKMLGQFEMLVAPRRGPYEAPERFRSRIRPLWVSPDYDEVSATEVRRRIQARQPWEPLVPPEIVEDVRRLYEPAN